MMPEPDGMEVLEKIKNDPKTKHIPVVILTNLSGKHDSQLAYKNGADDYWIKCDIKPELLGKKINAYLTKTSN
jgi:CheY-like chemotaxis protein